MKIRRTANYESIKNMSAEDIIQRYENEYNIRIIKNRISTMNKRRNIIYDELHNNRFIDDDIWLYKIDEDQKLVFIRVRGQYESGKIHTQFGYDGQDLDYGFYMDLRSRNITYDACELSSIIKDHKQDLSNQISEICGKAVPHISLFITNRKKFCDEHRICKIFNLVLS